MSRPAFYDAVYDLLIATGNVRTDSMKHAFVSYFMDPEWPHTKEWRFQGHLGFGGKFWANDGRHHVSYYGREDWSQERDDMVKMLNLEINKLESEHGIK